VRIRPATLLTVVAGALILLGAAFLRSRRESPPPTWGSRAPEASAAPVPARPAASPSPAAQPSSPPALRKLSDRAAELREAALAEIKALLESKGGSAALERIAAMARRKPQSTRDRLESAYFTRLIPFVATEDPSLRTAAVALALEIVRLPQADEWTRYQALAGMGGIASTRLTTLLVGESSEAVFVFNLDTEYPYTKTEWERGPLPSTDLPALLPALLGADPDARVREIAAVLMGRDGSPAAAAALERGLQTDADPFVREACLNELASRGASSLPALRRAALEDAESDVRTAALRSIAKAAPNDPQQAAFLAQATLDPRFAGLRPALAETAFQYASPEASAQLRPALLGLLTRNAGEEALVDVFVQQATERGLTEYEPIFRALASGASPELRTLYERGIRKLDDAPRSVALAEQIRAGEREVLGLWEERNRPGTSDARKDEIDVALNRKVGELAARRIESRR
jgi:hypothetical protein